jgi:hypothetical protein
MRIKQKLTTQKNAPLTKRKKNQYELVRPAMWWAIPVL